MWDVFPYSPTAVKYGLGLLCLAVLWVSYLKRKFLWGLVCLIGVVYGAFVLAFISPYNFWETYRIHSYSVPYVMSLLFAVAVFYGNKAVRNIAFVAAFILLCTFIRVDSLAQKIWLLGNRQDEMYAERMRKDFLPRLQKGKHYRLTMMGVLYGRQKFAGAENIFSLEKKEQNRELFSGSYYLCVMSSSGFFMYEKENPIWSDALFVGNRVFRSVTGENVLPENRLDAEIFAGSAGQDKSAQLEAANTMQPYLNDRYYFIGEKDIFLIFQDELDNRNTLIKDIQ